MVLVLLSVYLICGWCVIGVPLESWRVFIVLATGRKHVGCIVFFCLTKLCKSKIVVGLTMFYKRVQFLANVKIPMLNFAILSRLQDVDLTVGSWGRCVAAKTDAVQILADMNENPLNLFSV